jgi:hypothetical protein
MPKDSVRLDVSKVAKNVLVNAMTSYDSFSLLSLELKVHSILSPT